MHRQPEITDLEVAVHVYENVRWFNISVHYVGGVEVEYSSQQLVHEVIEVAGSEGVGRVDQLTQVY